MTVELVVNAGVIKSTTFDSICSSTEKKKPTLYTRLKINKYSIIPCGLHVKDEF